MNRIPSFLPGFRVPAGEDLQDLSDSIHSVENGITAFAGGGQASARQLTAAINRVTVVGSANDSVKLPQSVPGAVVAVINSDAADSLQVFGYGTDTINGVATGTGVAQAAGITALYFCAVAGSWHRILSA